MIRHCWSLLCSSSAIDKDENKVSLFEILEQITVLVPYTGPGNLAVKAHLVTLWRRERLDVEAKTTARIRLVGPAGETLGKPNEYTVDLTKSPRLRQRIIFNQLVFTGEGLHEFVIELPDPNREGEWREVARVPLDFVVKPAASETSASGVSSS